MSLAGAWYASGIFWGAVTAVVGLAAAVIALIAWRVGPPRRLLTYRIPTATALLSSNTPGGLAREELRVTYRGTVLTDPYVISLRIENQSRRDISSKDFDAEKPLVFEIGANIVGLVGDSGAINLPANAFVIESNEIKLGPTLINQRQVITFNFLIDGQPQLKCESSLIEVTVREESPEDVQVRVSRKNILKSAIVIAIMGAVFLILITTVPSNTPKTLAEGLGWFAVCLIIAAFIAAAVLIAEAYNITRYVVRRRLRGIRHHDT